MNLSRKRAYVEILIATAIWGTATPIIKYTLDGFDTVTFLLYRFGLSSILAIILFIFLKERLPKDKKTILELLGYSFLSSTISLGFLFFGLENTTVLDATLITLVNPLLVAVAGVMFLNEHVTKKERMGMTIALLGTVLTVVEPLIQNNGDGIKLSGNIFIIGSLISSAWSAILAKRVLRLGVSPFVMTNTSFVVGFLSLIPIALLSRNFAIKSIFTVPIPFHMGVFFMAFLSGSLAYYLSNKAQKSIEIGEASVFSYLYPIFTTPLAIIWLGEKVTPIFIVGGLIIAIGVFIAEWRNRKSV